MVQNLRAHFILYVITVKWIMCVQEKIKQQQAIAKNSQGWQKAGILLTKGGS